MRLTEQQLQAYDQNGFLLLSDYFSADEVANMKAELPGLYAEDTPARVLEKQTGTVRAVHGSHATNPVFHRLVRLPRMLEPAMQVLQSPVYVHQFKINAKMALVGEIWQWHQDYIFWQKEDGMPAPRALNMTVFLDDVTEFNGPLLFVPGSHKLGVIDAHAMRAQAAGYEDAPSWITNLTADLKYSLSKEILAEMVNKYGMAAPKGRAGSVLLFHPNVFHGSAPNMSPFDRGLTIVTYNSVENIPTPAGEPRPEFLVGRDYTPLEALAGDLGGSL